MKRRSVWSVLVAIILVTSFMVMGCGGGATTTAPAATTQAPPVNTTTAAPPTTTVAPATTASAPASGKVYNLKFSYHTPEKASVVPSYFKPWTAAIEQASNGRIKITHYGGESLVKIQDQYDSLVSGLSDIAMIELDVTPGRFPKTEFYTLPFISDNPGVTAQVYYEILQKYSVADELKEVKLLTTVTISGNHYIGNKEVKTLADFKGQRMRSGAKVEGMIIEQLGATPIEISTADMATSLERGLVDSEFLTISGWLSFGVKDVTKFRTYCSVFTKSWVICMNKKVWDSMPADLQQVITDNSGPQKSNFYSAANDKLEAGALKAVEGSDKGQSKPPVYYLPDAEKANWKAALAPVWDKWVAEMEGKKLPGKAIVADLKALIQKYSTQ
jgi:TRAP-type C4-dicarboxylate transport system substrate-binding protein